MSSGYQVEIDSLRAVLPPLQQSMGAAKRIKSEHEELVAYLNDAGNADVRSTGEEFLSAWGYGMGELAKLAEDIVEKLNETISAYEQAEQLGIEGFTPSDADIAKLPTGAVSGWVQSHGLTDSSGEPPADPRESEWATSFEDWAFG